MTHLLTGLHRLTLWLCTALAVVIICALTVQITSRYVFNAPVHMTDDIAEVSLIWLTFLGAAVVYREGGHIGLDLMSDLKNQALRRGLQIFLHLCVIGVLLYALTQVQALKPLMSRLDFGTLPRSPFTSKFALIVLPYGIGAGLTVIFAVEAIVNELRGRNDTPGTNEAVQ